MPATFIAYGTYIKTFQLVRACNRLDDVSRTMFTTFADSICPLHHYVCTVYAMCDHFIAFTIFLTWQQMKHRQRNKREQNSEKRSICNTINAFFPFFRSCSNITISLALCVIRNRTKQKKRNGAVRRGRFCNVISAITSMQQSAFVCSTERI